MQHNTKKAKIKRRRHFDLWRLRSNVETLTAHLPSTSLVYVDQTESTSNRIPSTSLMFACTYADRKPFIPFDIVVRRVWIRAATHARASRSVNPVFYAHTYLHIYSIVCHSIHNPCSRFVSPPPPHSSPHDASSSNLYSAVHVHMSMCK